MQVELDQRSKILLSMLFSKLGSFQALLQNIHLSGPVYEQLVDINLKQKTDKFVEVRKIKSVLLLEFLCKQILRVRKRRLKLQINGKNIIFCK